MHIFTVVTLYIFHIILQDILKMPKEDYGQALVSVNYNKFSNTLSVEVTRSVRLRPANRRKLSANPCAKM